MEIYGLVEEVGDGVGLADGVGVEGPFVEGAGEAGGVGDDVEAA